MIPEVFVDRTKCCVSDQEDCVNAGLSEVKVAVVESCVQFCRDFFRNIERQRGVCTGDDFEGLGDEFASSGALSVALTTPSQEMTDSRLASLTAASTSGLTFFLGMVTCKIPVLSRTKRNDRKSVV